MLGLYHLNYNSYLRSQSYLATLNSYTILHSLWGVCTLLLNYLITPRTNHTKVCIILKISPVSYDITCLCSWSKKNRLNPSIRPLYKIQLFSLICKRNKHRSLTVRLRIYSPVSDTSERLYYLYDS